MRVQTLTIRCDVSGCSDLAEVVVKEDMTRTRRLLQEAGWRLGAARDVCGNCYRKGHRP